MRVLELWRFPVKSLQGERVDAADLGPGGVDGDRRFAIFDVATGYGLTARRAPEMLFASARTTPGGGVEITLPDGGVAADDAALSAWLGRAVTLRSADEVAERRYENPDDAETEAEESWGPFVGADGAFHDTQGATVTVLSTTSTGGEPTRRFRANVVVEGAGEDGLLGRRVRIGTATLAVAMPIARCVMVTRAQPGGIGVDREVLRRIHREHGGNLAVGGSVAAPGTVRVGDALVRDADGPRPGAPDRGTGRTTC
ncbi:MAG: FIG060329: MOSC domain protein [uncultured Pseudonocardia sp.]|uniref:FIG060329: MOSC domain protein n=1 Tax=uncultured Pseudonocardia sp. TaxID=211455 RepID=A0A6J4PBK8_9PSEU|nr:MAG: FIG060329: MOSC domain protein [uncultured Pseudonocardia sp.]